MRRMLTAVACLLAVPFTLMGDPAEALRRGREMIAKREYANAVNAFRTALPEAARLSRPADQAAALSALHFYAAVALTEMGVVDEATEELRAFFAYRPGTTLDASRYSKTFLQLFDKVKAHYERDEARSSAFRDHYRDVPARAASREDSNA